MSFKALPGESSEAMVATEQVPDGYSLVDNQEFSESANFIMGLQGVDDEGLCVAYIYSGVFKGPSLHAQVQLQILPFTIPLSPDHSSMRPNKNNLTNSPGFLRLTL